METKRRDFLRLALAYTAASFMPKVHLSPALGQAALHLPLGTISPSFLASLTDLGDKILPQEASTLLTDWAALQTVTAAPPAEVFSDNFDPVRINTQDKSAFVRQTKVADRSLFVTDLPHITTSQTPQPSRETRLNELEMIELANTQNPYLYHYQCGCALFRVPLNSGTRLQANQSGWNTFIAWAYNGGARGPWVNLENRLVLDYVRMFCPCDSGPPLTGFAFRDATYFNGQRGVFSITQL